MKQIFMKYAFAIVLIFSALGSQGQDSIDTTSYWSHDGELGLNFSQLSLVNWNAGGVSSIALNGLFRYNTKYEKGSHSWETGLEAGYGFIRRDGEDLIKSDDQLGLFSQYNKQWKQKHLNYSALLKFNTQFTDGFNYPNDSVVISSFMAPAYIIYSVGITYKPSKNFSLLVSPITGKTTIVNDDTLAAQGAFGVDPGEKIRNEVGALLKGRWKTQVMENIDFETKLTLFSNYLENPQNIDVNWQAFLSMKVNSLITVTLNTELIYDDDIKIAIDNNDDGVIDARGPRIQFKELLGIGFSYKF